MSAYGEFTTVMSEERYLVEGLGAMGYRVEVHAQGRMSVFPLKFVDGSPDHYVLLGDSNGRLGLLEISIEGGEETGQRPVAVNAPELLLGDQQPRADPTFDLIAGPPSLHISANYADNRECGLDDIGAA